MASAAKRGPSASLGTTDNDRGDSASINWVMATRLRRRALALALLAVPIAARAQSSTALDFLKSIYEPYKKLDFKGQPYWEAKRFFVADLAEAIDHDFTEAKKRKEVPTLDGDPFIDAQDWDIALVGYAIAGAGPTSAAIVTLIEGKNGEPRRLAVFLVETSEGWRIDDIVGRGGSSLRALYKLK